MTSATGQDRQFDLRGGTLLSRLEGRQVPDLSLPSDTGEPFDLGGIDRAVLYFYPGSVISPEGGYDSPMLDEAQHRAFAIHWADLLQLGCSVFGVSSEPVDRQSGIPARLGIGHPLLCDSARVLALELGLPTFTVGETGWYCRVTLVVDRGVIVQAFYPLTSAVRSPLQAIEWMRRHGAR